MSQEEVQGLLATMQVAALKGEWHGEDAHSIVAAFAALEQRVRGAEENAVGWFKWRMKLRGRLALADELANAVKDFRAEAGGRKSETVKEAQLWVEISRALAAYSKEEKPEEECAQIEMRIKDTWESIRVHGVAFIYRGEVLDPEDLEIRKPRED